MVNEISLLGEVLHLTSVGAKTARNLPDQGPANEASTSSVNGQHSGINGSENRPEKSSASGSQDANAINEPKVTVTETVDETIKGEEDVVMKDGLPETAHSTEAPHTVVRR